MDHVEETKVDAATKLPVDLTYEVEMWRDGKIRPFWMPETIKYHWMSERQLPDYPIPPDAPPLLDKQTILDLMITRRMVFTEEFLDYMRDLKHLGYHGMFYNRRRKTVIIFAADDAKECVLREAIDEFITTRTGCSFIPRDIYKIVCKSVTLELKELRYGTDDVDDPMPALEDVPVE